MKGQNTKILLGIFCLCITCLMAYPAHATMQDFQLFSINIPEDWTIESSGKTHTFTEAQNQCVINVTVTHNQGSLYNELAILLYQSLKGKKPKDEDGGFSFSINTGNQVESSVRFTYYGENLVLVVASGSCDGLQDVVNTLKVKGDGPRPYPILTPEQ